MGLGNRENRNQRKRKNKCKNGTGKGEISVGMIHKERKIKKRRNGRKN